MNSSSATDDFIANFFDLFDLCWLECTASSEIKSKTFCGDKRSLLVSLTFKEDFNLLLFH
jgi:hypothetical protein